MPIGQDGQSFRGYVGIGEESTYGTGVAPTAYLNAVSDGFEGDNQNTFQNTTRARGTYRALPGAYDDAGGVDLPVTPEAIGLLLKGAFGSASVSVSDPDNDNTDEVGTHTFDVADELPSYSVELGLGDVETVRHVGVGIDTLSLEHSAGDRLSMSADMPAKEPDRSVSRATPSYDDLRSFVYHDGTVDIFQTDRTVDLQDVSFELANNLEKRNRDARTPAKMGVGERVITWSATLDFENTDIFERFLGSSGANTPEDSLFEGAVNAKWTSPETIADTSTNYSLEIDTPRVVINTHDAQLNQNDLIAENVEMRALVDAGGQGYDAQAILTNGQTSAY